MTVTNIQTVMLNGAIHSETAFYESRDSFHSLGNATKKTGRWTTSLYFACRLKRRKRNVTDSSPLIRDDVRSRKWVIMKGRLLFRYHALFAFLPYFCAFLPLFCLLHIFFLRAAASSLFYFPHSASFITLFIHRVYFFLPFNAHHE